MRRPLSAVIVAGAIFLLAACGAARADELPSTSTGASTPATAEAADLVDHARVDELLAQFPEEPPSSVVTTSVPVSEVLDALGVDVAGVPSTTTQQLPTALDEVERVGSAMAPDVEKIVSLAPGLVVSAEASRSTIEASLADTDIASAFLPTTSLEDLATVVAVLGEAFDKEAAADDVLASLAAHEQELASAADENADRTVLLLIGTSDAFMVMNDESFLGSLLARTRAENVAVTQLSATEAYSAVDLESIVAAAPDTILVLGSHESGDAQAALDAEFAKNPAWKSLPAFTEDRIDVLDYSLYGYTSLAGLDAAVPGLLDLLKR